VLKKAVNPTGVPIEEKESFRWLRNLQQSTVRFNDPDRCIHVGDRESDIYELFCMAQELEGVRHFEVLAPRERASALRRPRNEAQQAFRAVARSHVRGGGSG
jgi:hypothetical protein